MNSNEEMKLSLEQTLAMVKVADAAIWEECMAEMKAIGAEAAALAKQKASGEGFAPPGRSGRGTGDLLEKIGYSTRGPIAILRETSLHDGFSYPAVFEFGKRASWMDRPFLMPAIEELEPMATERIQAAVDKAISRLP